MKPPSIRLVHVDDHRVFRDALRALIELQPDLELCGEAANAAEALLLIEEIRPDVALVDLLLPDSDAASTAREILRRSSQKTRVIVLSGLAHRDLMRAAAQAGVWAYVHKSQPASELFEIIRAVARGTNYLPADDSLPAGQDGNPLGALSPREREVFRLITDGLSNQAAASSLGISIKTVETHRTHINDKLGIHGTAELIRLAARWGLLSSFAAAHSR